MLFIRNPLWISLDKLVRLSQTVNKERDRKRKRKEGGKEGGRWRQRRAGQGLEGRKKAGRQARGWAVAQGSACPGWFNPQREGVGERKRQRKKEKEGSFEGNYIDSLKVKGKVVLVFYCLSDMLLQT